MEELTEEIEVWQGKKRRVGQSIIAPAVTKSVASGLFPLKWIAVSAVVVALAAGTYFVARNRTHPGTGGTGSSAVQGPVTSVAVLPFYNGSGDPSLNWIGSTISDNLISEIGASQHLRMIPAGRMQDVLHDLRFAPQPEVDSSTLKSIHERNRRRYRDLGTTGEGRRSVSHQCHCPRSEEQSRHPRRR